MKHDKQPAPAAPGHDLAAPAAGGTYHLAEDGTRTRVQEPCDNQRSRRKDPQAEQPAAPAK